MALLGALRPPTTLVKVISVCRIHVFFHQYVVDLREERSENVLRTFAASPCIFNMAVSSTSGLIATPSESSAGEVQPLNTGVNILHGVNTGSPFVIPPDLGMEREVMQPQDLQTYRTSESRPSFSLFSLSASSSTLTPTQKPVKFLSSSSSIDRSQPLGGTTSPPPGEALLLPLADDSLIPGLEDPNTAVRREPFPGSKSPCYLPAYAMVRAVPSAGPSGDSDWVGFQDIYVCQRDL